MKISLIQDDNVSPDKKLYVNAVQGEIEVEDVQELGYYACIKHISCAIFNSVEFDPTWTSSEFIRQNCVGKINRWKYLANVKQTEFLCFDFDSGKHTAEQIHNDLEGYNHTIIGSKNHLKDKGDGKIIERFHVFIPTAQPITDVGFYKYIVKKISLVGKWEVDAACHEASHYYFKHSYELFNDICGKNMDLIRFTEHREKERLEFNKLELLRRKKNELSKSTNVMEQYKRTDQYKELVSGGVMSDGERYTNSSRFISCMIHFGLTLNEVLELFDQYSSYGHSFTRNSVIRRYNEWK